MVSAIGWVVLVISLLVGGDRFDDIAAVIGAGPALAAVALPGLAILAVADAIERRRGRWLPIAAMLAVLLVSLPALAVERSREVTREFQHLNPCPSTGRASGACPGFVKDHVWPLCAGGADAVANLQWQTVDDAKAKDRWEREICRAKRAHQLYPSSPPTRSPPGVFPAAPV